VPRHTGRLTDAGIAPSVGSRGEAYDNALAESVMALYKTELIRQQGPWRSLEAVEFATLAGFDWFNTRRLLASSVKEPNSPWLSRMAALVCRPKPR